jgi:hypothetical protein
MPPTPTCARARRPNACNTKKIKSVHVVRRPLGYRV